MKGKFGHQFEGGPVSLFECDKGSSTIHLDVPKDPVLGWTMKLVDTNRCVSIAIALHLSKALQLPFLPF